LDFKLKRLLAILTIRKMIRSSVEKRDFNLRDRISDLELGDQGKGSGSPEESLRIHVNSWLGIAATCNAVGEVNWNHRVRNETFEGHRERPQQIMLPGLIT
jgi:hypothetical protein